MKDIPASPDALQKTLKHKPILWIGAGASVAAGYPTTWQLLEALRDNYDLGTLDISGEFTQVVDRFVDEMYEGALHEVLQATIGAPKQPTDFHHAVAAMARAGCFHAIITTNYDDLIESALRKADVNYVHQVLEQNKETRGDLRLYKLHGSYENWEQAVLSKRAYDDYNARYGFLLKELEVMLTRQWCLFVGCSMQDPRILEWLAARTPEQIRKLKPWRTLMTKDAFAKLKVDTWNGMPIMETLGKSPTAALILDDHAHLPRLFTQLAEPFQLKVEPESVVLNLRAGHTITARLGDQGETWQPTDPTTEPGFQKLLKELHQYAFNPIPTDAKGVPTPGAASAKAVLHQLAETAGKQLAEAFLPQAARDALAEAIRQAGERGDTAVLTIRVEADGNQDEDLARADHLLALPWELLHLDGCFPVRDNRIDLVREAVSNKPPASAPDGPLSVLACIAAPVDAGSLAYEEESYRLWRALSRHGEEQRLLQTDIGTLGDLKQMARYHEPTAVHFTGHGEPGALLFEDDAAQSHKITVADLLKELDSKRPRLFYLSSCYGAGKRDRPTDKGKRLADPVLFKDDPTPATAATLHRNGPATVVAYLGPVGDSLATQSAAAFYAALAQGESARTAMRAARGAACKPIHESGRAHHVYPLGWAQLHLYHRGPHQPPALPPDKAPPPDLEQAECRRINQRLDHARDIRGVQRLQFGFIGRRGPRAELVRRWRAGERLAVVNGLGGLGKTALCTEVLPLLARAMGDPPILALDGQSAGNVEDPIEALWRQVAESGAALCGDEQRWSTLLGGLQQQHGINGQTLAAAIAGLAEISEGLLVYLDDAESLQEDVKADGQPGRWQNQALTDWWTALSQTAVENEKFGLLASTRYVPEGLADSAVLNLPVMRKVDLLRMLRWFPILSRLSPDDREWLAERVDGHPRTLEYLEGLASQSLGGGAVPKSERVRAEVIEPVLAKTDGKVDADLALAALWRALTEPAQRLLAACTQLNEPIPWQALNVLEGGVEQAVALKRCGLLSPFAGADPSEPWWGPHRLVAAHVRKQYVTVDERAVCAAVGGWYRERWEREKDAVSEARASELLIRAGRGDDAWEPTERVVIRLRIAGRYYEALARLEAVFDAAPTGSCLGKALLFRAQLNRLCGSLPDEAEGWIREGIKLVEGEDEASGYGELGNYYRDRGRLDKACVALKRGVEIDEALKPEPNSGTAIRLHNLATVLHGQGDLAGAEETLRRSLAIKEAVYGTERHPSVAASLHELATVLHGQGDLAGAEETLRRSLAIKEAVYGTERHPSVAASLHELARVLHGQGDLADAEETLRRSLAIEEAVYGTEQHPSVAASLSELARVLENQGDLDGAREMYEKVLAIEKELYQGRDHYNTAITETNLGMLLLELGEGEKGLAHLVHALQVFHKQLGPDHPHTQQVIGILRDIIGEGADEGDASSE